MDITAFLWTIIAAFIGAGMAFVGVMLVDKAFPSLFN